jgi:stress response protein YsnF
MTQNLTEQEISQLKSIQSEQESLVNTFGQLEYQIQSLEIEKEKLITSLEGLKTKEVEIGKELNTKYGNGTINLETGVFIKEE